MYKRQVVEELIPEMSQGKHSNSGTIFFAVGFSVMMTLDVALGYPRPVSDQGGFKADYS